MEYVRLPVSHTAVGAWNVFSGFSILVLPIAASDLKSAEGEHEEIRCRGRSRQ